MIDSPLGWAQCPLCHSSLRVDDNTLACTGRHRFNIAKQGHINLLSAPAPINADDPEMISARERYLSRGFHDAVRNELVTRSGLRVVDAGSGPGWYLSALPPEHQIIALDLSAAAIKHAAKAHPGVVAFVCDVRRPWPVQSNSVDSVWSIFAPRNLEEAARVLQPSGELHLVIPGPTHLQELITAGLTIGQHPEKEQRLLDQLRSQWRIQHRSEHTTQWPADRDVITEVCAMGPSAHHRRGTENPLPTAITVSMVILSVRPIETGRQ